MPTPKKPGDSAGGENSSKNDELITSPDLLSITRPLSPRDLKSITTEVLFHRLWTLAVHTPGYSKREWMELARRLETNTLDDL